MSSEKKSLTYNTRRAQRRALKALGIVEKRPVAGNNVSHAQNRTKRLFKPNLQKATVMIEGKPVSVRLDTRSLRSLTKALKERTPVAPKRKASATKRPAAKK